MFRPAQKLLFAQVALSLCFVLPPSLQAEPVPSPALLADLQLALAGTTNVQSDFTQEKDLAVLQHKVILKGRLAVQQPAWLSWQVTEPIRYNLVLDGTTLQQWDEATDRIQKMSLAGNPVFGVVAAQLQAWFAGRFDTLLKDFSAVADGSKDSPTIVFTPREGTFVEKAIRRVVLTLRPDHRYLSHMLIEEKSGDRTLMTFTNTLLNATLEPTMWEVKPHGR
jgi:outer membrane lipoprotein-sorting protein